MEINSKYCRRHVHGWLAILVHDFYLIPLDEGHPEFVINEAITRDAAWPPRSDTGGSEIISVCVDYREDIKLLLLSLR